MLETRASLNYLLDGGRETCRGVRSACFEVLNLCAGVSRSESGSKEIWREPSYIGPEYETVRALVCRLRGYEPLGRLPTYLLKSRIGLRNPHVQVKHFETRRMNPYTCLEASI